MIVKKIIIFATLVALCGIAFASPKGVWVETKHDFGTINENDGDATCVMKLVNVGDEPLVIVKARASCGCTRPKYSSDPIAPGDTLDVTVAYDPVGRPGRFSKKIYIDTNGDEKRSTLTISGVVIASEQTIKSRFPIDAGKIKLRKRIMPMGEIKHGKAKSSFLEAYNQSNDTLYPKLVGCPEYLSVVFAPKAIPPGEQATLSFYLNTFKSDKWGLIEDKVYLIPEPGADSVAIEVSATIVEDFSKMTPGERMKAPAIAISPERIDLGVISPDQGVVSKEFSIQNYGDNPLLIRRVYGTDGIDIEVEKTKIKKGKTSHIKVSIDQSKINNKIINARVTIIANDPERSISVVRVVGEVK